MLVGKERRLSFEINPVEKVNNIGLPKKKFLVRKYYSAE